MLKSNKQITRMGGAGGEEVRKVQKKCDVLFEWPLIEEFAEA